MLCKNKLFGPGGGTRRLHHKHGDEIGLTVIEKQRLYPVLYHRYRAIL